MKQPLASLVMQSLDLASHGVESAWPDVDLAHPIPVPLPASSALHCRRGFSAHTDGFDTGAAAYKVDLAVADGMPGSTNSAALPGPCTSAVRTPRSWPPNKPT